MVRGGSAAAVALALWTGSAAAEPAKSVAVYGGPVSLNDILELATLDDVEYAQAIVVGVAGGLHWDLASPRWRFSIEAQVNKYFGSQESWEFNLVPAMLHYVPQRPLGPLDSVGFGLGFSYASEPPAVELERGPTTTEEKVYWTIEAAFDTPDPNREVILRIHHRSTASETIGFGRSTNAVVFGLRQYF